MLLPNSHPFKGANPKALTQRKDGAITYRPPINDPLVAKMINGVLTMTNRELTRLDKANAKANPSNQGHQNFMKMLPYIVTPTTNNTV